MTKLTVLIIVELGFSYQCYKIRKLEFDKKINEIALDDPDRKGKLAELIIEEFNETFASLNIFIKDEEDTIGEE